MPKHHLLTAIFASITLLCASSTKAEDRPPNLVVILADDLGIECVGTFGGKSYETPNIDQLAASGIKFTHCFSAPYCSPSRAQLLTGLYPLHNGIKRVIYLPEHTEYLDPQKHTTFAKELQKQGYKTAIAGKWQLSFLNERDTINDLGFDEYQCWQIFVDGKKTSRYVFPTMRQNGKVVSKELGHDYGPDANAAFLIDFMERHKDQPFCVYYTALLPHYPWEPTPDSAAPLEPADGNGDWKKYMPDMVKYLDKQVGQMVAALDRLKLRDNTLVLFVADNGTDRSITSRWGIGDTVRSVPGGKGTMTDAGTRVPLVVNWPGKIKAGSICDDLVDLSDIMPTLLEVTSSPAASQPVNGISFAPQLFGETGKPRTWVHVQNQNSRHIRSRDYILSSNGKLRPVVEIGQPAANPIAKLNDAQQAEKQRLEAAMRAVETLP